MRVPVKKLSAFVHQEFTDLLQIDSDLAFLHNHHHQLQSMGSKHAIMIKRLTDYHNFGQRFMEMKSKEYYWPLNLF